MRNAVALGSALSLFGLLAAAAPVPKETNQQQVVRLYGTPVDPNKDCEFAFDGKKLTVKAGKGDHALTTTGGRTAAPRTLREVEGDFTVEVTAAPGERPQKAKPAMEGRMLKFHSQGCSCGSMTGPSSGSSTPTSTGSTAWWRPTPVGSCLRTVNGSVPAGRATTDSSTTASRRSSC